MRELALTASASRARRCRRSSQRDADAYGAVSAAYKLPSEPDDAANARQAAITDALLGAAEVPLETARACAQVAELAATCATKGNTNAVSDAASPRCSPTPPAAAPSTTFASTSRRSRTSRAARGSSPRRISCSRRRGSTSTAATSAVEKAIG